MQYYFHTKEELLVSAIGYLAEQLGARVRARLRAQGAPPPRPPREFVTETLLAAPAARSRLGEGDQRDPADVQQRDGRAY